MKKKKKSFIEKPWFYVIFAIASVWLCISRIETPEINTNLIFLRILLGFVAVLSITVAIYFHRQKINI
jgi:hypothetical protein